MLNSSYGDPSPPSPKKIKQNEKKSIEKKYIKNEKIKQDCAWGVKDQRITINKDFNCI